MAATIKPAHSHSLNIPTMKKTLKTSTALVVAGAVAGLLVGCGDPPIEGDKDPTDPNTQVPGAGDANAMEALQAPPGEGDGGNDEDGGGETPHDAGATPPNP